MTNINFIIVALILYAVIMLDAYFRMMGVM